MEIEIIPKEEKINKKEREQNIRRLFGDDFNERNGILCNVLVFMQIIQPCSVNELKNKICSHYALDIERTKISRAIQKLKNFNLIDEKTPNEILLYGDEGKLSNHIIAKYNKFLSDIPTQFKKNYGNMKFYFVSNGEGIKFLPYCCKLLGFKIKGIKDELDYT